MNRLKIQSTVDESLKNKVEAYARRQGLSVSKAVEVLVREGLDQDKDKK